LALWLCGFVSMFLCFYVGFVSMFLCAGVSGDRFGV
jgi:hypothetical protein